MAGAVLNLVISIPRQVRRMRTCLPTERRSFALRVAVYDGAVLVILAAGISLAAGHDSAFYLIAGAAIALTLLAIANSWSLTLLRAGGVGDT